VRRNWPARTLPVRDGRRADALQLCFLCTSRHWLVVVLHRRRPMEGQHAHAGVRRLSGIVYHAEGNVHARGGVLRATEWRPRAVVRDDGHRRHEQEQGGVGEEESCWDARTARAVATTAFMTRRLDARPRARARRRLAHLQTCQRACRRWCFCVFGTSAERAMKKHLRTLDSVKAHSVWACMLVQPRAPCGADVC
jgi:hypothetical protein